MKLVLLCLCAVIVVVTSEPCTNSQQCRQSGITSCSHHTHLVCHIEGSTPGYCSCTSPTASCKPCTPVILSVCCCATASCKPYTPDRDIAGTLNSPPSLQSSGHSCTAVTDCANLCDHGHEHCVDHHCRCVH